MKKVLAVTLIIFILIGGILGCKKPKEPDPHEGLYGTYVMMEKRIEIYFKTVTYVVEKSSIHVSKFSDDVNAELKAFITDVIDKAGDTIAIYKDKKIKFSGGSMEREFDYKFTYSWRIFFDNDYFPFYAVECDKWISYTPPIYQLETRTSIRIDKELYSIHFFYKEENKF